MNAVLAPTTTGKLQFHAARPSFFGLVRGELLKVTRQWSTWILLILLLGVTILPYIIETVRPRFQQDIASATLTVYYDQMSVGLSVLRVFTGFFLLIVTARMIGQEYQQGTIRVLLARGVGRLQLLFAKLFTLAIIALVLLVAGVLLNFLLNVILITGIAGNLDSASKLTSQFWSDTGIYVLYVLLNMGVTILLATATSVIGRASVFGIAAALAFFPLDNFGTIIMLLANRVTHSDFWLSITAYFLGPNLNVMPSALTSNRASSIGLAPLYNPQGNQGILVDGTHTLVVAGVYAAIFAAVAIWLTWKRDVKE